MITVRLRHGLVAVYVLKPLPNSQRITTRLLEAARKEPA